MAKRLPADVYQELIDAGFDPAQATVMTAIAGAESGYDDTNLGDVGLEDNQWGPSYGLFQIRTLKGDTGSGSDRDIAALTGNDTAQAAAAFQISSGGRDFTPWTTFTSGAYQAFLPAGQEAAAASSSTPTAAAAASSSGPFPTWGPDWLPWNWASDAANAAAAQALGGARQIVVEAVFVLAGVGLVVAGLVVAGRPAGARVRARLGSARRAVVGL